MKSPGRISPLLSRAVKIVIAIEVVWLTLGNIALNTQLGHYFANLRSEKFELSWRDGWTLYPLQFQVRDVVMQFHTWSTDSLMVADQVRGRVRVLPLLHKTAVIDDLEIGILRLEIQREKPEGDRPPPTKPHPGWTIDIRDAVAGAVETLELNRWKLSGGTTEARASAEFQIRGDKTIYGVDAEWRNAVVHIDDVPLPETLSFSMAGGISPFNPRLDKGRALAAKAVGEFTLNGKVATLVPLQYFFPGNQWIERIDGDGNVDIDARLAEGRIRPGSRIDIQAENLLLEFLGYRARGAGAVTGTVTGEDNHPVGELQILFNEYDLVRRGIDLPLVHGRSLSLNTRAISPGINSTPEDIEVSLRVPESVIPDITLIDQYLPPALGLRITSGEARIRGEIDIKGLEREASARLSVDGNDIGGNFRDTGFNLDFNLSSEATGQRLDDFKMDLGGTTFRLFNGTFDTDKVAVDDQWWMNIVVPRGTADMSKPFSIEADVDLAMKDTRAIIALFAEIKDWVRRFDGFLTVQDVKGAAHVTVADKLLRVRDLTIQGDRLELVAEVAADGKHNDAVVWGKLGAFSGGFERIGDERKWKLVNGRKWFKQRKQERWTGANAAVVRGTR